MVEKEKFLVVVSVLTGMKLRISYLLWYLYVFTTSGFVLFEHVISIFSDV